VNFKQIEATKIFYCDRCSEKIEHGEKYYRSYDENKFLSWLNSEKICKKCYEKKDESDSKKTLEDFNK